MLPTALVALLLLTPAAKGSSGVPLARATQPMVEVTRGEETYRAEKGIAADDAGAVAAYLRKLGESRPEIVRVPGRPGVFLASDFCGGTGERVGRCLFLLWSTKGTIRELARASAGGDADGLRPVVFTGAGRRIVLAELGTEYTSGVQVYELEGTALRALGKIDAGVPGELGEEDPTPYAKVRLERGRVVVRFETDLVLGTGDSDAPIATRPVVFRQRGSEFVREKGKTKPRPSPP